MPGMIIEAGAARGGSSLVLAVAKAPDRLLFIYDTFEMIPEPSANDGVDAHARYQEISSGKAKGIGGGTYYGYQTDLYDQVRESFNRYGLPTDRNQVHLVKGLFQNTLAVNQPVALAHIDCDWYDLVMICLQKIVPQLVPGGVLVINDYYDWSGCRKAVDEFFAGKHEEFVFEFRSRLHIKRIINVSSG